MLREHQAVSEVAVVGVPDAMLGQRLKALVVIEESYKPLAEIEDTLRRFLISQLADFKVPSNIVFVNSIPKSNRGKILRKEILSGVRQNM